MLVIRWCYHHTIQPTAPSPHPAKPASVLPFTKPQPEGGRLQGVGPGKCATILEVGVTGTSSIMVLTPHHTTYRTLHNQPNPPASLPFTESQPEGGSLQRAGPGKQLPKCLGTLGHHPLGPATKLGAIWNIIKSGGNYMWRRRCPLK